MCMFDYLAVTKAMLSSAGAVSEEWIEVELTADTGASATVMPRSMCSKILIRSYLQSLRGMEYKVANGQSIPNLGECRCLVWTEWGYST